MKKLKNKLTSIGIVALVVIFFGFAIPANASSGIIQLNDSTILQQGGNYLHFYIDEVGPDLDNPLAFPRFYVEAIIQEGVPVPTVFEQICQWQTGTCFSNPVGAPWEWEYIGYNSQLGPEYRFPRRDQGFAEMTAFTCALWVHNPVFTPLLSGRVIAPGWNKLQSVTSGITGVYRIESMCDPF